nr:Chain A, SPV4 CAPSID PROTEIN VP1 [Escherichia phage phiX174]
SNIQTGAERMPHDLSHLGFLAGQIGRLITISTTPVIAGDSFEMDAVGALRLSPLRRGLAIDSTVDIFTFYVPHRHVYGEQWIKFMKDGVNATPLPTVNTTGYIDHAAFLGTINPDTNKIPKHLFQGYLNIYNNYFKAPWMPDRTEANPNELNQDDARYGFRCCHLKNIWTAPLPPETELSRQMTTSTGMAPVTTKFRDVPNLSGTPLIFRDNKGRTIKTGQLGIGPVDAGFLVAQNTAQAANGERAIPSNLWADLSNATSIDIMGLQAAYANLHTDQERDYFMQRYRDVISSFGGKTSYDADNRPLLVMRSNLWASGYDVDGTDQTSLGQFSGRVQQTYKHSVPRFFVPEHGTMFTLALVRFPPTATKEIQYLNAKGALTYTDIAGDPVLYGNLPPREISMKDVFRSGDSSKKFKIAEGQWYRYAPSYVSPAYHLLEGFPFIQEPPSGDLQERVLIRHHDYDQCFQSVQLLQWNSQVKFNVTVYRNLPTTRDSIMTS